MNASDSIAYLVVEPGAGGGNSTLFPLTSILLGGVWSAMTIEFVGAPGDTRLVKVTINGTVALSPIKVPPFCKDADRAMELSVGLFCVGDDVSGKVEAWYDNVRITVAP